MKGIRTFAFAAAGLLAAAGAVAQQQRPDATEREDRQNEQWRKGKQ